MNVFDIIGPVMVGPSSSHTAGAVRIGRIARALLGAQPVRAHIVLYGSFAKTYKGHGTDKALVAGLLDMLPDDGRIRDSLEIAVDAGMDYTIDTSTQPAFHPNTAVITAEADNGKSITVQGSSVGGGNIIINKINDIEVSFKGDYYTLVITHKDTPGAIAEVTNILALNKINIAAMNVYRSYRGGSAIMVIETDQALPHDLEAQFEKLEKIKSAIIIAPV